MYAWTVENFVTSADALTKDIQGKKSLLTNVQMDERTVKMGTDRRMDARTNGKLFSKVGWQHRALACGWGCGDGRHLQRLCQSTVYCPHDGTFMCRVMRWGNMENSKHPDTVFNCIFWHV